MANIDELKKYKKIHMIGIGGISMSGIAEILKNWGFTITGSDTSSSEITEKLEEHGIHVTIGHDLESVANSDVVVYSAAIHKEDVELQKAMELNIPIIERADFLGKLTKAFRNTICISGTHGKTTTTSMVSLSFLEACKDPSIQVGAYLKPLNGNYRVGNSEYFIIEACEYVESFLKFFPKAEIILNIDNDHLDYFKNIDNIKKAFCKYVNLLPSDGLLVINADDENCQSVIKCAVSKVVTYGIENSNANFIARNITFNKNGFPTFDVYHNNCFYKTFQLSIPGLHNVMNALACIALCHEYKLDKEDVKNALAKYTGAHRRFEFVGTCHEANIYDDYGHHPTEIKATAEALKKKSYNESWVVFQPHTYSRTKNLLTDFAKALSNFDHIIVTDIYAAREYDTYGVSSKDLVKELQNINPSALYISDFNQIVSYLKDHIQPNDIVLTQGAGTVTDIGPMLAENVG